MAAKGGGESVASAPILLATWRLGDTIVDGTTSRDTREEGSVDVDVRPSRWPNGNRDEVVV
jgi:hypothetical protein